MVRFGRLAVVITTSVAATFSETSSTESATHITRSAANMIGCTAAHPIKLRRCPARRSGSPRSTSVSQPPGAIVTAMAGMGCVLPNGLPRCRVCSAAETATAATTGQIADRGQPRNRRRQVKMLTPPGPIRSPTTISTTPPVSPVGGTGEVREVSVIGRGSVQGVLDGVLGLFAGLLDVRGRLIGLALGLQALIAGRPSGGLLDLAGGFLAGVLNLVSHAHRGSLSSSRVISCGSVMPTGNAFTPIPDRNPRFHPGRVPGRSSVTALRQLPAGPDTTTEAPARLPPVSAVGKQMSPRNAASTSLRASTG